MSGSPSDQAVDLIVLAAGKGTRLKSDRPKVLHSLFGKPLLHHVLEAFEALPIGQALAVVGHERQQVCNALESWRLPFPVRTIVQDPPAGTGDAVRCVARSQTPPQARDVIIAAGDVPLLKSASLQQLLSTHREQANHLTLVAAQLDNPTGYGRVIVNLETGEAKEIVEEKDATPAQKAVRLVNAGLYCWDWQAVSPLLEHLTAGNAQQEFYLTDIVSLAAAEGLKVGVMLLEDALEMTGVNSRQDLAECHQLLNERTQARLMAEGVQIIAPQATWIGPNVEIGADTVVYPGCYLEGEISIGRHCAIGPHTQLGGRVRIGDRVTVAHSVVRDAEIAEDAWVGPFAHLRDGVSVSHHVKIGNFVEVKNTSLGDRAAAAHLAYLGDARLGADVNIGAGTITANYDPIREAKHQTIIEDRAKVGSNSVLIAPVTIGEDASVAAGSVITKDVAPWDLAIARGRQTAISNWVKKTRASVTPSTPV
jgi:bifunctional UDP-N-acetylglucosamine pyrophosphorylase/glucosamine-1-phosphate N-acetyltransferase